VAKVIVHGADRAAATERMRRALDELRVDGIRTTIPLHRRILEHPDFIASRVHTRWVEEELLAR